MEKLSSTSGIVQERLWASIAKIVVYHFFQLEEFITYIINEFGSKSTEYCYNSLLILKNIPQEIEYFG